MPVRVVITAAAITVVVITAIKSTAVVARVRTVKATPGIIATEAKYRRRYHRRSHHHIHARAWSGHIIIILNGLLLLLLVLLLLLSLELVALAVVRSRII